jgi:hypothetical protein
LLGALFPGGLALSVFCFLFGINSMISSASNGSFTGSFITGFIFLVCLLKLNRNEKDF